MRTFPQGSICFFILCQYFPMKRIFFYDFDSAFYHFCQYYYRHNVKVDAIFFCYISGVLREHRFENLHEFHSHKFYNNKWKTDYSLQECSMITWSTKFLLIFKNSIATACYLIFPWKLRDLKYFLGISWNPSKQQIHRSLVAAIQS